MNKKTNNEELLDDVLGEAAPAGFREGLLDTTLQHVRRRRRFRYARNAAGVFVALALLVALVFPKHAVKQPIAVVPLKEKPVEKSYTLISTQPLPAGEMVTTPSRPAVQFISSRTTIEVVQSTRGNYRLINDQELLALVAAHHAALVRTGPNSEKLIFANPQDAKAFLAN